MLPLAVAIHGGVQYILPLSMFNTAAPNLLGVGRINTVGGVYSFLVISMGVLSMRLASYVIDFWSAANFGFDKVRTREMGTIAGLTPPCCLIARISLMLLSLILRTALGGLVRK